MKTCEMHTEVAFYAGKCPLCWRDAMIRKLENEKNEKEEEKFNQWVIPLEKFMAYKNFEHVIEVLRADEENDWHYMIEGLKQVERLDRIN